MGEHLFDLLLGVFKRNILNIDVVDELSDLSLVLWLELASLDGLRFTEGRKGLGGRTFILEADESVSSGGVVSVEGDLKTLDISVFVENIIKLFVFHVLWKLSHENVVTGELVLVSTK